VPKILVVDAAEFMRMRCTKMLSENGHEVVEASTGREALEQYKSQKPDAVLLDMTMPDMDGLTALKAMRAVNPNAKVAMVTAMGQQTVVMEALKAGALDFVVKPFDPARLLQAVQKMLAA